MLAVVGDLVEDIVVRVDSPPAVGTDTPAVIERRRGGSAANVAAGAAQAGTAVRFIGRVGDDDLGTRLVDDLAAAGVDIRAQREGRTGTVVVLVGADGERTMLPDRGAATDLADVDAAWIDGVTWLHVPSYSLLSEPIGTASKSLIATVRSGGGSVSVDVSSVAIVRDFGTARYAALLDELVPDVVFANADEAELVPPGGRWTTVVKDGPRPVRVISLARALEVPVPAVDRVVDTTGAGDAFAAGYLTAAMDGADERGAAEAGIALATRSLCR